MGRKNILKAPLTWAEKYYESTLCLKKSVVVTKKHFHCTAKRKEQNLTPKKNHSPPALEVKWMFPNMNVDFNYTTSAEHQSVRKEITIHNPLI